jgi:hypothetical protein
MSAYEEGKIHVGITRRLPDGKGGHIETTINLSGIPAFANSEYIRAMRETAHLAREMILDEIEGRAAAQVESPAPRKFVSLVAPDPTTALEPTVATSAPTLEQQINAIAERLTESPVPAAETVDTGTRWAFLTAVRLPADETAFETPITRVNADGTGGGQLKAINTSLSAIGYKDADRFAAINTLLEAFTSEDPGITSTNDLTRADAHMILEWIERADDEALAALEDAVAARKVAA